MGSRLATACAALALLTCSACGSRPDSTPGTGRHLSAPRTGDQQPAAPYVDATGAMRATAISFVRAVLEYDSAREKRTEYQQHLVDLATPKVRTSLLSSPRSQLPWPVLRARHEQVRLKVRGVSLDTTLVSPTMIVAATRITRTDLGEVTDFVELRIGLRASSNGWKVDSASGPGL